jgi:hypothetical protein
MKTKIKFISLLLMLSIGIWVAPQKASAQMYVSFQVFYDDLSPYGTWVNSPNYGYVWIPNVDPGFTPYATNGYWVFTDDGWTWVSNYPWGWAPFHYGRWYTDATYGPMWVPDNEWGPGWVTWRRSSDYYGWAQMEPGISISVAYGGGYYPPHNNWTIMRGRDFGRTDINNYYVNSSNNVTIINNSTVINNPRMDKTRNVTYNAGPDRTEVEKHIGKTITPITIKESSKPGQNLSNNQLQIYRPQVKKNSTTGTKPAPSKVENFKNVKTSAQRTAETPTQKANQVTKKQQSQTKQTVQPNMQKQSQTKQTVQPNMQKQSQPKQTVQPNMQKQSQPKQTVQPNMQKQTQTKQTVQPNMQKQSQPKQTVQPNMQKQSQQKQTVQPNMQKQSEPKQTVQPTEQKQSEPKQNMHPAEQKQSEPKQEHPTK